MTRRWTIVAVLAACALLGGTAVWRLASAAPSQELPPATRVVVVGVPGLGWDDVGASTPNLLDLAGHAALGSLTTRGATSFACPRDGWVTLGAGNRALFDIHDGDCRSDSETLVDEAGVERINDQSAFGADPGLLGDVVLCTRAFGRDAAFAVLGAANVATAAAGQRSPARWRASWAECPLALVSTPVLRTNAARQETLARVDALVGRVAAAVAQEPQTLLLVVGVSDSPGSGPAMRVAIAAGGADLGDGPVRLLRSATTGRAPYVQLIDVAPTALEALGIDPPAAMLGRPVIAVADVIPADQALSSLRAASADAQGSRVATLPLIWVWVVVTALYCLGAVAGLRISSRRTTRVLRPAGVAVAAIPVASLVANLAPWQRAGFPTVWMIVAVLVAVAMLTFAACAGPWRSAQFGPHIALAVLGALVLGLDVTTGSHLQLDGPLGYSPLVAGRFIGFGNIPFAVFATCGLLAIAAAVRGATRRAAALLVAVAGVTMVLLDGMPGLGADVGGVLALVPALLVTGMLATGIRVSLLRGVAALGAGVVVVAALAIADYQRPPQDQTHLGRFVGQVLDGTALSVVDRKASANLHLLLHSPVAILAPVLLFTLWWLLAGNVSLGRRVLEPTGAAGHAALAGTATAATLGTVLNDSGIAVFVAAGAVGVPLLLSAAATSMSAQPRVSRTNVAGATPAAESQAPVAR